MRVALFGANEFEIDTFKAATKGRGVEIDFFKEHLGPKTAGLAKGHTALCAFVNDTLNSETLVVLAREGVRFIALRSAGYNNVDLASAKKVGIRIARVPEYSPYAVAEHATALLLTLNRKIHRAHNRVREGNFSLDGLVGFDLHGKTIGVIGTGKIGAAFARIMIGYGCRVLAYDRNNNTALEKSGVEYVTLDTLIQNSDVISLHVPLNPETHHILDDSRFKNMKPGVFVINTGRGALIDTKALIRHLKTRHVGGAGLDVYEEEEGVFFENLSDKIITDDVLARLMTFPNVLITSHQAFLTKEALSNIAQTTVQNIIDFRDDLPLKNEVKLG